MTKTSRARLARALASWRADQIADLCALIESKQLTPELAREALDPGPQILMVGTFNLGLLANLKET